MFFKQKMVKISSRALLRIPRKHTTFSTFLSKRAFASNFFTCFELLQQRLRTCQGHHPCQIIPCGTHSFFLRARTPKSSKTNGFLKNFSTAYQKSHESHRRSSKKTCTNFQNLHPRALSESYKIIGFSTFMTQVLARATFARSFNAVARLPGATIPCKKYHAGHMRASSSRRRRRRRRRRPRGPE